MLVVLALGPGLAAGLVVGLAPTAQAHEERPAVFPDGDGSRPAYLGLTNSRHRVVCRPDSRDRIARMPAGSLKSRNRELLRQCRFHSIQDAINTIKAKKTSIYVLPGVYPESKWANAPRTDYCSHLKTKSNDPLPASEYIGSITSPGTGAANAESNPIAVSYSDQRRCAHNLNLIALFGDNTPKDGSIDCNSVYCGTQIVGTGRSRRDVLIDNRYSKLNAIRADRMGGIYLRNFTVQQSEFNAVYVMETDGFAIDRVVARANDEYGMLTFASDHGLIQNSEAYFNGDSGIYPGSASDLNADNPNFKAVRYAIEIRHNNSHDNTLGYSGTAGNSIWAHDNKFHDNATGIATDSLFPGHPGLPQDHARWSYNKIFHNNKNWYTRFVDKGICDKPMKQRGYLQGTVCPVVPTPVGSGILIAGGNFNSTDHNWIFDNWRYGTMQFWVPAVLRDEYDPAKLYDTSHHNHTTHNHMGIRPGGAKLHNGMDHWWDDEGAGNCWEDNDYSRGHRTDNFTVDPPSCAAGGSLFTPGATVKDAGFLSCSQYDRSDPVWRHPPNCTWFDSPSKPTAGGGNTLPLTEKVQLPSPSMLGAPGLALLALAGIARKRRRDRQKA